LGPAVGAGRVAEHVLEVRACRIRRASAHGIKVAVSRKINANRSDQHGRHVRTGRPTAARRSRRWGSAWRCGWSRSWRTAAYEIDLADAGVPGTDLGILVDMPEVHAIGGIDFCPRIITPADATVESDSRKHD